MGELTHLRTVGGGASSTVSVAKWRDTAVAVKTLAPTAMEAGSEAAEFLNEANVHKGLRHPHVVQLLGVVTRPSLAFVMEFMERGGLDHVLHHHQLPWSRRLGFALDIAREWSTYMRVGFCTVISRA